MDNIILTALSSLFSKQAKAAPPLEAGMRVEFDETVTIRLKGLLEKGEDEEYKPTIHFAVKTVMAALMMRMGAVRESNIEMCVEAMTESLEQGKSPSETFASYMRDAEEAMRIVEERILDRLPKQVRSGKTKVTGTIEEV